MIVPKATVRVVDRLDPTLAPAVVANVPIGLALFASLTSAGGGRPHTIDRAGVHAARRPRLPAPRADLRRPARGQGDAAGNHRRRVRAQRPQLRPPVRVPRASARAHVSADDLRESTDIWRLVTAAGSPSAGASPARMVEFSTRQAGGVAGTTATRREIVTCRDAAGRLNGQWAAEMARAGTVFGQAHIPGCADRRAGPRRTIGGAAGRPRLPHRRIAHGRRDHAPADGAERGPRRGRAMGGGGRQRGGAQGVYGSPRRGTDRLRLPGDRPPGRDLGAAAPHRLRVPLRRAPSRWRCC